MRRRLVALAAVLGCLLANGPAASSTAGVGSARNDLHSARAELHSLDIQLSLAAERLHEQKVLLATLQGDLSAARARAARADAAAAGAADAFDAMVRWAYESGASSEIGVLGLGSIPDLAEGVGLLSAMATHQEQVAATASETKARAAEIDGQTSSLEAQVSDARAAQRRASRDLNTGAARQRVVIAQLERQLHHRIKVAIADRRAAKAAAAADAAAAAAAATPDPTTSPAPTGPSGTTGPGPLPGPTEPAPTTGEIVDLITATWGTGYDGQVARCVGWRESRYQPTARNTSSGAAGLFQLMPFWWDGNNEFGWRFDPYDAKANVFHAHLIWKAYGWEPWTTGHLCV